MATYDSKPDMEKKVHLEVGSNSSMEKIENVDTSATTDAAQLHELSAIEQTAASKGAWLISFVISLGGLLFGYVCRPREKVNTVTDKTA
jgi:SP family myo-inositol transporter-like MFS transporter 13